MELSSSFDFGTHKCTDEQVESMVEQVLNDPNMVSLRTGDTFVIKMDSEPGDEAVRIVVARGYQERIYREASQ